MKKKYESPLTEVISLEHRDPVLDGGSPVIPLGALVSPPSYDNGVEQMTEETYTW